MTKRKGKSANKQDDSLLLLETPSVTPTRGLKEYAVPAIVFFIFAVGGSTAVWFCSQQQQQTIDSLTETVNAMQLRITKFQQQLGTGSAQIANVDVFEERLLALEEAFTQAQKRADVALASSEKVKSTDFQSQVWSFQSEMNDRLSELQQESVSTATLNAVVKNKTKEIETLKQRLNSILTANSEVAVTISGLTDTVLVTKSRLDEQISTVEGLTSELEEQRKELANLKESFASNKKALQRNRQEVMDFKDSQIEQAKRSQALEEQLMAVRSSLEDHQKSTHNLHSHLAAQLEIVQSQMLFESQHSDSEEEIPVEEQQIPNKEVFSNQVDGVQTITKEETLADEVLVEEGMQMEEPAEEVQVHEEEQDDKNEFPEEAEGKEDFAEEEAVTEEVVEVPFHQDEVKEEVSEHDENPEELQAFYKEKTDEDVQVLWEGEAIEPPISEEFEDKDGDVVDKHAAPEKNAIPEEDEGKYGDDQAVTEENEITEEIPIQEEEAVEEQAENVLAKEEPNYMEETIENFSEDQVVDDISQEEMLQEPFDEIDNQKDLEEAEDMQDSHEESEPAEDIVEELDEQNISANER